jgi:hypothetical protein
METRPHYSLRKLNAGLASVLLGLTFVAGGEPRLLKPIALKTM